MDKTILVGLRGHDRTFRLDEAAYDHLSGYLDRAAARLSADPERDDVLGDLERSVGDKLTALPGSDERTISATEMDAVLEQIGAVDPETTSTPADPGVAPKRRLMRIREGQQLAGVCNGLAAYAEVDVAWVRTFFLAAALLTAGFFILVYIALIFILPIAPRQGARP
jgi:phage shock protein PspC (stress-responsive transcriptional regulator)